MTQALDLPAPSGLRAELADGFASFAQSFWRDGGCPPRTLELCRLRIAAIHDCDAEWLRRHPDQSLTDTELTALKAGDFRAFSDAEQSALAVAEKTPFNHHGISDADVTAMEDLLGSAGAVSVLTATAFFDTTCRWQLVMPSTTTHSNPGKEL